MCRISGLIQKDISEDLLTRMRDTLVHGGPDDAGNYISKDGMLGLSQRRLSILDLSSAGHQPMRFNEWVIVYNGEVYNFKEIAVELLQEGYTISSESDTEIILKAFDCWGVAAVQKFRGMFAFALWNEITQKLLLCRDRVGVKPLYWYLKDGLFMFASELKAFHEHPNFDKTINQGAVSLFLQTGYIRSPYCIYESAHKLEPGNFLEIDLSFNVKKWKYWSVREKYYDAIIHTENEENLINECENLLTESFKLRMVSDVPVGMFLSGGIDSSLVTALLQKDYSTKLKTFTIGFEDKNFNEAQYARAIAQHIGTDHTELYCNERHFQEIISKLPTFYDEPFGDSSAIPTYLVSQLARKSVSVSLSADGGDELFTGYNRYLFAEKLQATFSKIPQPFRYIGSGVVAQLNTSMVEYIIKKLPVPEYYKKNIDARIPKMVEVLKAKNLIDFLYSSTIFLTKKTLDDIHKNDNIVQVFNKDLAIRDKLKYGAFGVADIESYLEGDILAKVDRATMQVALEGREPFLDHKIIEFALALPDNYKIRNGKTKWILRQILYRYVPKQLIERPKMGFGIPLDNWIRTLLRPQIEDMLLDNAFFNTFRLNNPEVKVLIKNYFDNKCNSPYFIWYLYNLHQWYLQWK